ncbi:hypothetical protein TNCV_15441 [Trichonephila clavipes]|nr:hypothetical protein TNCV_15441 [Trichonephila clavipes]
MRTSPKLTSHYLNMYTMCQRKDLETVLNFTRWFLVSPEFKSTIRQKKLSPLICNHYHLAATYSLNIHPSDQRKEKEALPQVRMLE